MFERMGYYKVEQVGDTWVVYDVTVKKDIKPIAEFQNEKDAMLFKNIKDGSLVPVRSCDLNRIGEILINTQKKQAL